MKKITAKYITENLEAMAKGEHINRRGCTYWMACNMTEEFKSDINNGTIYRIGEERNILGAINGHEYAKVIDGIAYRI